MDRNFVTQILISIVVGGLIGYGFEVWRGNPHAVWLCMGGSMFFTLFRLYKERRGAKPSKIG
jgi:hypothetical protein